MYSVARVSTESQRATRQRQPEGEFLRRCAQVAQWLTGRPEARAEDGVAWLRDLCRDLEVRPLSDYGITGADLPSLVERAKQTSSMRGNPVSLTDDEIGEIVRRST